MSEDPISLAVIDTNLADLEHSGDKDDHDVRSDENAEASTSIPTESKGKKAKKAPKGIVKGSTADYRRKEANRLAAERSRSRQSERRAGVEAAFERLTEENARLAEEISSLEGAGEGERSTHDDLAEAVSALHSPQIPRDEIQSEHTGHAEERGTNEALIAEEEAQAHSRTILAALMSDAEINQALGEDWMSHVDEAEVGAANQTAQTSDETDTAPHASTEAPLNHEIGDADKADQAGSSKATETAAGHTESEHVPDKHRQNAMAVAIHAELERHVRDDLAATKAAIDRIDKELAFLRRRNPVEESVENPGQPTPYFSTLPAEYTSSENATIVAAKSDLDTEMSACADRMGPLRERAFQLRESRLSEAQRLERLLAYIVVHGEQGAVFVKMIKPLRTYLAEMINKLQFDDFGSFPSVPGSRMAPAIAPRRRGRPPSSLQARRLTAKGSGGKKSKLRQEVHADDAEAVDPERASSSRTPNAQAAGHGTPVDVPEAEASQQIEPQADAQAEPAMSVQPDLEMSDLADEQPELTTEQIISQRTHDEQDLHDLLQSHAQAEYDAQQHAQAEGISLPSHFGETGVSPNNGEGSASNIDPSLAQSLDDQQAFGAGPKGSCDICSRTQTTVWRKIHLPDRDLHVCNPCGMYHIKTGQIRPRDLWGDGKLIRKRRKSGIPRSRKFDAKRQKVDAETGHDDNTLDQQLLSDIQAEGPPLDGNVEVEGDMTVDNLGDVVGHDDFRASLGMDGLGDMITGFTAHADDNVAQNVAHVFGSVE